MSDIFISYSHEDRDTARRYAQALLAKGLSVRWDDALRSGEAFYKRIEQALRAAKAVVVPSTARCSPCGRRCDDQRVLRALSFARSRA
jgi:hypothetical protein